MRWSQQPRLKVEMGLLTMIRMDSSVQIDQLLDELEELKKKANGKSPPLSLPSVLTETPIRGSVKATQPTLRTDQMVSPFSIGERSFAPQSPLLPRQPEIPSLSAEQAHGKWTAFVDQARKERIAVGTMLSETTLLESQQGKLRIGCPDDFHIDALKRNRQFLSDLAHRVYGAKVLLETILRNSPDPSPAPTSITAQETSPSDDLRDHPIVKALKKEFGAIEVE